MLRLSPVVAILTLGLLLPPDARAALGKVGDETTVNGPRNRYSGLPDVIRRPEGFLVVWSGMRNPAALNTVDILARSFDSSGRPTGRPFIVNTQERRPGSAEVLPIASPFADGGFVVGWENDFDDDGDDYGVFGRVTDKNGRPRGNDFKLPTVTTGAQTFPWLAAQRRAFVASWQDRGTLNEQRSQVYVRRFARNGEPLGPQMAVSPLEDFVGFSPSVATSSDDTVLVVWETAGGLDDQSTVIGRWFDKSLVPVSEGVRIDDATFGSQRGPAVAHLTSKSFVVAWLGLTPSGANVFARRAGTDSNLLGDAIVLGEASALGAAPPRVAASGDGDFVVVWAAASGSGTTNLVARHVSRKGIPDGPLLTIAREVDLKIRHQYAITHAGNGEFAIVWEARGAEESTSQIRLQRVCTTGGSDQACGNATCSNDAGADQSAGAMDAAFALQSAVSLTACEACRCDVDSSGTVTASDALAILRHAVDPLTELNCPSCDETP
ncbi:MAG TPA: hypothetical protein VEB21_18860 [Terriglobales bacterium]|nr:hypothetical protein [Terriglobales bacterium]